MLNSIAFFYTRELLHFFAFLSLAITSSGADMVQNWEASLEETSLGKYKLIMQWDHVHSDAVMVDYVQGSKVYNPVDDPRCHGNSDKVADDGQPFWMPRFFPRTLSSDITAKTGFKFASVDWQPCGHKDIVICHAESHYDFHLYYATPAELNALPDCRIGTSTNPKLPVCEDSPDIAANHDYFKLISSPMPVKLSTNMGAGGAQVQNEVAFCVDPTSAILRSGVHYGDKGETLNEWKTPVTIIGSHNCTLNFFEPMVSWNWISGCGTESNSQIPWPVFKVTDIEYNNKSFVALPLGWQVEVSAGCKAHDCQHRAPSGTCHIKIVVEGNSCPPTGCPVLQRECGEIKDCLTDRTYQWTPSGSPSQSSRYLLFFLFVFGASGFLTH